MIVVDASVLVTALADDGTDGEEVRSRLHGERLVAPHLVDVEVVSAWRRLGAAGALEGARVALAITDLATLRLRRVPHAPLLPRCWELRHALTTYDATYVALAEALEVSLLTADGRVGRAPGIRCQVEVIGRTGQDVRG